MTPMRQNAGRADRILRVALGLLLIGLAAFGVVGMWGMIGLVPVVTGLAGYCPLYQVFGFSTCKTNPAR